MPILSQDQCHIIHQNALEVLQTVGFVVDDDEIYARLLQKGAKAGTKTNSVLLPPEMVEESLEKCPSTIKIGSRQGGATSIGPGGPSLFWTGNALHIAGGRDKREIESRDLQALTRVADACSNVDAMVGTSIADFPAPARDFVGFKIMAHNTRKHLRPCIFTPLGAEAIIEEAEVLANGTPLHENPIVSFGFSIVSPLHWSETGIAVMRNTSGKRIPFMINSEPMAGGTAPVTLAGCLVSGTAETMSGVVIAQLLEPGRPIVFNLGFAHVLDMSTAMALTGAPENALLQAAGAEISRYFNLPSASWMSTESLMVDGQASFEKTLTSLAHAESGVNIVWGMGNLEGTMSAAPEMLVIDDEIVAAIKHFTKGIAFDDDKLALPVIKEVGLEGDFLSTDHTFEHFRSEIRHTKLIARSKRGVWEESGRSSLEEKASDKVQEILKSPMPEYIEEKQSREIDKIVKYYLRAIEEQDLYKEV